MNEWIETTTDVNTIDWSGNRITIRNVPAMKNSKTKKMLVSPNDVVRAEFTEIAKELKIEDRDILLFFLLYAKPGPFQRGYLVQKYKLNKMLFYQWKWLEREGFGDNIPRDEFEVKARGPVPKNLWNDLKRLHDSGFIDVEGGEKQNKTVIVELTDKGEKIAKNLWNRIADPYTVITTIVKNKLFALSPESIKELVHKEYPSYREKYKYADREEKLKI